MCTDKGTHCKGREASEPPQREEAREIKEGFLLEVTSELRPFHHRGLECKSRKSRDTWNKRQVWPWSRK